MIKYVSFFSWLTILFIILSACSGNPADLAQQYPELNATYYALIISFLNSGLTIGYSIAGLLLMVFSETFMISTFLILFFLIILVMTGFQLAGFLIFNTIKREEYELKNNIKTTNITN